MKAWNETSDPRTCQQIRLLDGVVDITQASDRPAIFLNPTAKAACYAVVISSPSALR